MSHLAVFRQITALPETQKFWIFALISALFAIFGRLVRGVTTGGAVAGAVVCFALLCAAGLGGFAALFTVFALTWLATRIGYARKQGLGMAEARAGRNALQVLANLGTAAGCAAAYTQFPNPSIFVAIAAALAEATADTVSSEIGQAMGGTPRLITTWQRVDKGTNGAVTGIGTAAGSLAGIGAAFVFFAFGEVGGFSFGMIAVSAIAGMFADSLLGATLEGRKGIENNVVNFISTLIAATLAFYLA